MEDEIPRFKLILLGNIDVGKTSLILRFIDGNFTESFSGEIDQKSKVINVGGQEIEIMVNDTAGQERFRALTSSYYRSAHAIIVVYDITDKESFDDVEGFVLEGERYSERSLKFILANKIDLEESRVIKEEEGKALAQKLKLPFLEVSAKTGVNIDEAFNLLTNALVNEFPAEEEGSGKGKKKNKKEKCVIS